MGEEPPLPANIDRILKSSCPYFAGKKVEETHMLTLIPKTVNGKPLTLDSLEEFVKHPKQGQGTQYKIYLNGIKSEHGEQSMTRSYWVLMTKDVIPGSRGQTFKYQEELLEEQGQKAKVQYKVPLLLEASTSILLKYLRTGERLFSDHPKTYTRCQERVSSNSYMPLVVGNFSEKGLRISGNNCSDNPFGLAGLRRFNS